MAAPNHKTQRVWPLRVPPLADELLSSWLVRLADAYGMKAHSFCAAAFPGIAVWNRDIDRSAPRALLVTLSRRTGVPFDDVLSTTLRSYMDIGFRRYVPSGNTRWVLSLGIFHRVRRTHGLQFCPQCLHTDAHPYFRRRWRLGFVTCCLTHRRALLDRCDGCGAPVQLHRGDLGEKSRFVTRGLTICPHCHADYRMARRARTALVTSPELAMQRRLQDALRVGVVEWPGIGVRPLPELLEVLHHLARLVLGGSRGAPLRRVVRALGNSLGQEVPDSQQAVVLEQVSTEIRRIGLVTAGRLLDRWPRRFVRLCRAARVWRSNLLSDFRDPPEWFRAVVETQLYLAGFVPGRIGEAMVRNIPPPGRGPRG